jgi:hypothetical protein
MRIVLALAALLAIAGCATPPPPPPAQVAQAAPSEPAQQVCHKETPTGSTIARTVCEPAMSDADRRAQMTQVQNDIRSQSAAKRSIGDGR